jgi:citrate lyase subunit gamma (acyl carrier protein)
VFSLRLKHGAVAGTFESSDAQVTIQPIENGIEIEIESSVIQQYGLQIEATVEEVLQLLEVENAKVIVNDKGALDCTIRARVQTAIFRACDIVENLPWGKKL